MTKTSKLIILSSIFFLFFFSVSYSQDSSNTIGRVSIASPTAASLGKYGDIPVDYHTGIPQINIPIYTVKSGSLSLPIGLSYHASGLKVQEQASWVGAGWSLNAGGVITRTVQGAADDKGYSSYQGYINACSKGHYSDYGYNSWLVSGTDSSLYNSQEGIEDQNLIHGYHDGEPDLFFFNFGGYTGKFYFNDERTPIIVPEQDFNIQPDYQSGPGFNGFVVITPDGTKYYFGRTGNYSSLSDPVESTIPSTINTGPSFASAAASSWYLNKIMSADGMDSITLQYKSEKYSYYSWSMFPITPYSYVGVSGTSIQAANGVDLLKNMVNGVRLTKINFPLGNIVFTPSATPRKDLSNSVWSSMTDVTNDSSFSLGSIQISDNNTVCKKDSFYYGYFRDQITSLTTTFWAGSLNNYNLHSDTTCLRLDSIIESSCDRSLQLPPYKFSYFTDAVPRRLSFGLDHWGFYNGVNNNYGLIPTYMQRDNVGLITQTNGANREAAWPAMRGGTLQKITYPTGGYTLFDFEAHNTHSNFSTYVATTRWTPSVGYDGHNGFLGDGGDNPIQQNFTFSGSAYLIISSNTNNGISGSTFQIQIKDINNNIVFGKIINPGQTDSSTVQFAGGTYSVYMYKQYATTGYGASAQFKEWVATPVDANTVIGGLRIKSISNNDGVTSTNLVTNFSYNYANNPTGNSSGILYSRPVYVQWIRNKTWDMVYSPHLICDNPSLYKSAGSLRPMSTTQGNHIGYNEVYVSQPNNGYTVYKYFGSDIWDYNLSDVCVRYADASAACNSDVPTLPAPPLPFEYMRGQLKYEANYNQAGQILADSWHFPLFIQDSVITFGHIAANLPSGMSTYTEYILQSAGKVRDSVVSTTYVPNTGSTLTNTSAVYYNSRYHHQATSQLTINSTGELLTTKTKYAFDFQPSTFTTPDSVRYYLNNIHTDSVNVNIWFNGCPVGDGQSGNLLGSCHHYAFVYFRAQLALHRMQYVAYRRRTFVDPNNTYSSAHTTAKNSAGTELKPIFELQDFYQNPAVERTEWRNSNLLHANFTRFDYATNPSGKVYPQKTQLINLSSPSGSFTNAAVSSNTITKDSRYKDESSCLFNAGNPIEVTPYGKVTNSYIWDYQNTQPIAKVAGASNSQIAYTSFESDGKGNWTFSGTPGSDNTAPTGKKIYTLNGSNNITKSGLTSTTTYIVSYWSKNASAYTITGTISGYPVSGRSADGWKYFEHRITGQTSITISGSGTIDELRLYPVTAQMATYTYNAISGITTECDLNNRINYYQYDTLGRLMLVKDQDKYITKRIDYKYASQIQVANITITSTNSTARSGFSVVYTKVGTGEQYSFSIPSAAGQQTLGTIPAATYNVTISKSGNLTAYYFEVGPSFHSFSASASFSNVPISASTNNYVVMDTGF